MRMKGIVEKTSKPVMIVPALKWPSRTKAFGQQNTTERPYRTSVRLLVVLGEVAIEATSSICTVLFGVKIRQILREGIPLVRNLGVRAVVLALARRVFLCPIRTIR